MADLGGYTVLDNLSSYATCGWIAGIQVSTRNDSNEYTTVTVTVAVMLMTPTSSGFNNYPYISTPSNPNPPSNRIPNSGHPTFTISIDGYTANAGYTDTSYSQVQTWITLLSGSKQFYRGTSNKTVSCVGSITAANGTAETARVTQSPSTSVTIPARPSYTVSYNANGGSGAPSSQTVYYNSSITLSSTIPVRNGYTFQGWSTSSTGSVNYSAGATFNSTNANITLYAVWKQNQTNNSGTITLPDGTKAKVTTKFIDANGKTKSMKLFYYNTSGVRKNVI